MTMDSVFKPRARVAASLPVASTGAPHFRDAYQRALPAAQALGERDLIPLNIDLPTAVTTSIGSLGRLGALRARIVQELPGFDVGHLDQLETYTLAAAHAHAVYLAASAPPEELTALAEQGAALRDTLYSDAVALAKRGIIPGERLSDFKANVGFKNLAFDLLGLATLLRQNWQRIASRTALVAAELEQAEALGEQLVAAVGAREQARGLVAEGAQQRQRVFSLFVRSYNQVRRAISYLRWDEGDLERIAPSLYGGRKRRKVETPSPVVHEPAAPTAPELAALEPAVREPVAPVVPFGLPASSADSSEVSTLPRERAAAPS
jgi:hypothetical protein